LALQDRARPVIAFTGDGGLMMCLGELSTAAQERVRVCVVVFNDASLSLIELKQRARKMPREGVDLPKTAFAVVAEGFGLKAWTVDTVDGYRAALAAALAHDGPTLIDVAVDPSGYGGQLAALRN
jgi:acetolactate synthase-1/2/3 large subunit